MPLAYLWLVPLGVVIGLFGTLIGAGGGFILAPLLLILFPKDDPAIIASISLGVVFVNATMGSISYARMGRIDYRSGIWFSIAGIPGAALGAFATQYIPRRAFELIMGLVLLLIAAYIGWRSCSPARLGDDAEHRPSPERSATLMWYGAGLSFLVGLFANLLGLGGGIIHVPALTYLLDFPVHTATATSHFILAILALTGTVMHIISGTFIHGWRRMALLAVGVAFGAPIGARLSNRVSGIWIARSLAAALALVALRLLVSSL